MLAGKAPRTKLPHKARHPSAPCLHPLFCGVCKPHYSMALAMDLHPRLGEESPVAALTEDLLRTIIDMTKPTRRVPSWLSCDWDDRMLQRRRACAVLFSARRAQRRRELHSDVEYKSGDMAYAD